jgi:hypothetical protein
MPEPTSGDVWWCDGVALGFEAHFKRRPVLVLTVNDDGSLLVAPLSSKRLQGQETPVTHDGGVSYLTGRACTVPPDALLSPLGTWEGFADWRASQERAAEAAARTGAWLARLRRWLSG